MAETSVLFVDDEPNVLQGIRRMLRHRRNEWDMHFADGGRAALALLAARPIDVVVTDMRMPEMDGATLLEAIQKQYPDTLRFVLSGQCDEETALRAVGVSHQYLSKPCDADELEGKIERALRQRATLAADPLRRLMSGLGSLPSRPSVYSDLLQELGKPQIAPERIDSIVAREPGLAAKLLQICNSSYFGVAATVRSVHQAVQFLGFDTLKALALGFGIVSQVSRRTFGGRDVEAVIDHCLCVGSLARSIALGAGLARDACDDAYMAGLMHDIGILVLAENLGDEYDAVLAVHGGCGASLSAVEREILGADHAAVAAYLLGTWGLPSPIVQAIGEHHRSDGGSERGIDVNAAVQIAELLMEEADLAGAGVPSGERLPETLRILAGVEDQLASWCARAAALTSGPALE